MGNDELSVDISDMPDVVRLADEVARTRRPCVLTRGGDRVALVIPLGAATQREERRHTHLVDATSLPPVPFRTIDELLAARPAEPMRYFSDKEIEAALEQDRVERWRAKSG